MAEPPEGDELDALVSRVLASPKYRSLLPAFVARVGERERRRGTRRGDALRATKSRLHQSVAAFRGRRSFEDLEAELRRSAAAGALPAAVRAALRAHASTRERLPILDAFASEVLGPLAGAERILDLACGLFPLALPLLPFHPDARYRACDVDLGVVELLNGFFRLADRDARAFPFDLSVGAPPEEADVALLLKSFPCLEHLEPGAGMRVLEEVRAPVVVVSFPGASLGGRRRGMGAHHEELFRAQAAPRSWQLECRRLPGEVVFVVRK